MLNRSGVTAVAVSVAAAGLGFAAYFAERWLTNGNLYINIERLCNSVNGAVVCTDFSGKFIFLIIIAFNLTFCYIIQTLYDPGEGRPNQYFLLFPTIFFSFFSLSKTDFILCETFIFC